MKIEDLLVQIPTDGDWRLSPPGHPRGLGMIRRGVGHEQQCPISSCFDLTTYNWFTARSRLGLTIQEGDLITDAADGVGRISDIPAGLLMRSTLLTYLGLHQSIEKEQEKPA